MRSGPDPGGTPSRSRQRDFCTLLNNRESGRAEVSSEERGKRRGRRCARGNEAPESAASSFASSSPLKHGNPAPDMLRRKEPKIPDAILDQLLAGADAKTAFDPNGLLDELNTRNNLSDGKSRSQST